MRAIAAAYNETDNKALARLQAQANDAARDAAEDAANDADDADNATEETASEAQSHDDAQWRAEEARYHDMQARVPSPDGALPQARETIPAPLPQAATPSDAMQAAVQALQVLLHSNGTSLDANAVRAIIRDELPNLIPVTRLEIVTPTETRDHGNAARHKSLPALITILSQKIPAALVGPAGSGKTTAAEQAASALNIPFYIQGAVQGAHELLGFVDAHGNYQSTPFRQAFEHGGTICLDELDAGDSAGILVLNSALANGCMPFPDQTKPVPRHADFNAVACLNTYGNGADRIYVGRNQLDGATLDRFAFLNWSYDERLERAIAGNDDWTARVQALRSGAAKEKARVVISPRASIFGARLLAAGMLQNAVEELTVWKGVDADLRRRIEAAAI
jgi:hypothetical protein